MSVPKFVTELETHLLSNYGPLLSTKDIAEVFKYSSTGAVRKAHELGNLPVKLHKFQNRRGFFATAKSVAIAIASLEEEVADEEDLEV